MRFLTFIAAVMIGLCGMAQNGMNEPLTGGSVEVSGFNALSPSNDDEVVDTAASAPAKPRVMNLYRINVYSQLDRKGGRELVKNLKAEVDELFPELCGKTHTEYQSPYFRMWVGWFYSETEANKVATDLKKSLRRYRKDITITKRRVIKQSKSKAKDGNVETNENQKETD